MAKTSFYNDLPTPHAVTAAEVSAAAAALSASNAASALHDFNAEYLGAHATDPTADGNGNALAAGMIYFNSAVPEMRHYTGTAWVSFGSFARNRSFTGSAALDSSALLTATDTTGGFWSSYSCKTDNKEVIVDTEAVVSENGGGIRDGLFLQHVDRDVTNYEAEGNRVISNGIRSLVSGKNDGSGYILQYKDMHGVWAQAVGNTSGTNTATGVRGVAGVLGSAVQLGAGSASNEFSSENPAGSAQAALLSGTFSIVQNGVAPVDGTHLAYGSAVSVGGKTINSAFRAASFTYSGDLGSALYGMDLSELVVTTGGIRMAASAGNAGTIISYDTDDYSYYDRANNVYNWTVAGSSVFTVGPGWTSYTPVAVSSAGTITTVLCSGGYADTGSKGVCVTGVIVIYDNGTGAGRIDVTLPFTSTAGRSFSLNAHTRGIVVRSLVAYLPGNSNTLELFMGHDGSYPGSTGEVIEFGGVYERA